jgi:hypothetical protein
VGGNPLRGIPFIPLFSMGFGGKVGEESRGVFRTGCNVRNLLMYM